MTALHDDKTVEEHENAKGRLVSRYIISLKTE
jgi:hypothetical protein